MKRRYILKITAAIATSALFLGGCAVENSHDISSSGEDKNKSVVSVGLGDVDTLLALGVTPTLFAAWSEDPSNVNGLGPWAAPLLKTDTPPEVIYGTGVEFNSEHLQKIAAADPSQIIAVNTGVSEDTRPKFEALAPVTYHSPDYPDWQVPWRSQVESIAGAVGKEEEGKKLISDAEKEFATFREEHPDLVGKKAAVALPYNGLLGIYTNADGRGAILEELGFEIPAEFNERAQGNFYFELSPENYDLLDSLDYLFVHSYEGGESALKESPLYNGLNIVKDNRVFYLEQQLGNAMSMPNPVTIPWVVEKFGAMIKS